MSQVSKGLELFVKQMWSSGHQLEMPVLGLGTLLLLQVAVRCSLCLQVSPPFVTPLFPVRLSVLADNLKSNPGIKWQYFSSEEGIFTVFPAHKFRCKGSYEHRSRYDVTPPSTASLKQLPVFCFSKPTAFVTNSCWSASGFLRFVF